MPLTFRRSKNLANDKPDESSSLHTEKLLAVGKDSDRNIGYKNKKQKSMILPKGSNPQTVWKLFKIITNDINFLSQIEIIMVFVGFYVLACNFMTTRIVEEKIRSSIATVDYRLHPGRVTARERPNHDIVVPLHLSMKKRGVFQQSPKPEFISPNPNYGLKINFLGDQSSSWIRNVKINQNELIGGHVFLKKDFEVGWRNFDKYYAFDDDIVLNEKFNDEKNFCRRVAWHRLYNPSCNTFHETELLPSKQTWNHNKLLGEGSYREAFFIESVYDPELVIKLQRFADGHYATDRYEFVRMDALIMERLTASPRIVDSYGHCATSVLTEYLPKELENVAVRYFSKTRQTNIFQKQKNENRITPLNDLTMEEKLNISIQMAEALADLHGFEDGVIVHDDVQLAQFLFNSEGIVKLNDFNRGEAMFFNEEKNEYCRYQNGAGGGDWRSPEEYSDKPLNEKIDVWSFGNNLYSLMTGLYVFHDEPSYKEIKRLILNGNRTIIDDAYRKGNNVERKFVDIIEKCWTTDPDKRPSIFDIISYLKRIKIDE